MHELTRCRLSRLPLVAVAASIVAPGALFAQNAQATSACAAAEHRQFDFWAGEWEVHTANGLAGTNTITPMLNDCVLHEQWEGTSGSIGESFNIYDGRSGTWHQTWVDNGGLLLRLDGGLEGESMVLRGELTGQDGTVSRHRVTWTPLEDGSVRQHWQSSSDDGGSWNTLFDGNYRRKAGSD